jgi:Zn-dependent membrane protease YugP
MWLVDAGLLILVMGGGWAITMLADLTIRRHDGDTGDRSVPSGGLVARAVLSRAGIGSVVIREGDADCYQPATRTIVLEAGRIDRRSNATAAIAAHEAAHAVQHLLGHRTMRAGNVLAGPSVLAFYSWFPVLALSYVPELELLRFVAYGLLAFCLVESALRCWVEIDASRLAMHAVGEVEGGSLLDREAMREVLVACGATYVVSSLFDLDDAFDGTPGRRDGAGFEGDTDGFEGDVSGFDGSVGGD